jgi:hypothetical protein
MEFSLDDLFERNPIKLSQSSQRADMSIAPSIACFKLGNQRLPNASSPSDIILREALFLA